MFLYFHLLERQNNRERETEAFYSLVHSPRAHNNQGKAWSSGTLSSSATWVTEPQALETLSAASQDPLVGTWIGNAAARTQTSTLIRDVDVASCGLTAP